MNYLILVETEFFALINGAGNGDMGTAYNGFVESVISLCYGKGNHADAAIALAYAENELQHHHSLYDDSKDRKSMFVRKALSFIRKMRKHAASSHIQVPPLSAIHTSDNKTTENPASPLQWTGNAIDLVELIYGIYRWAASTTVRCRSNSLPRCCTGFSVSKPKTATASTPTSNDGKQSAIRIFSNKCRRG